MDENTGHIRDQDSPEGADEVPFTAPGDPALFPRFQRGVGDSIGSARDRGKLTRDFRKPGLLPDLVTVPDVPRLPWKVELSATLEIPPGYGQPDRGPALRDDNRPSIGRGLESQTDPEHPMPAVARGEKSSSSRSRLARTLRAPSGTEPAWGESTMKTWEIHPAFVHFPLAFLLGAVVLDLYNWWRPSPERSRVVAGLLAAGVATGWPVAAFGGLAYYTVPAHAEGSHLWMKWHLGLNLTMLVLFTWVAVTAWRRSAPLSPLLRGVGLLAAVLLIIGGYLGGMIVYRGGAGVAPEVLAPEIREGHSHGGQSGGQGAGHSHGGDEGKAPHVDHPQGAQD